MGPPIRHPYKGGVDWALMKWMDIEDAAHPGHAYLRRLIP